MRMYTTSSRAKRKCFHRKNEFPLFLLISGRHIEVHQYGNSIPSSIKLRKMFGQITQKWCTTQT